MEMIFCPNCKKLTGYKRALGFGTFFAIVLTVGFWLLAIPFYQKRCINCGLSRAEALPWYRNLIRPVVLLLLFGLLWWIVTPHRADQPAQIVQGPNYNEVTPAQQQIPTNSADHELHVMPGLFGDPVSDGRTYSIVLVAGSRIPPRTKIFAQGELSGFDSSGSTGVAYLRDEQSRNVLLACSMTPDEFDDARYLYHVGQVVQVVGGYAGTFDSMPLLRDCEVASPTDKVVRPTEVETIETQHVPNTENNQPDSEVYTVGGDISAPRAIYAPDPEYTDAARKAKLQGSCELEFVVGMDGHTRDIRVARSLNSGLDENAMEAVQQWRFDPAMKDGKPVAAKTRRLLKKPLPIHRGDMVRNRNARRRSAIANGDVQLCGVGSSDTRRSSAARSEDAGGRGLDGDVQ